MNNEYTLWTPNSFTPNGDQKNDGFKPISTGIEEYRLLVYDRWGKLIFDEIGESPIWDGNDKNGVPCKTDSYSYRVDYKTFSGESSYNKWCSISYSLRGIEITFACEPLGKLIPKRLETVPAISVTAILSLVCPAFTFHPYQINGTCLS